MCNTPSVVARLSHTAACLSTREARAYVARGLTSKTALVVRPAVTLDDVLYDSTNRHSQTFCETRKINWAYIPLFPLTKSLYFVFLIWSLRIDRQIMFKDG